MNKLAKTPKDTSDYEREKELLQSLISDLTKDLKHTKDVSLSYEQLIKSNKKRLDEEIARNSELRNILQKSHTMTAFDYQRIINSLTQTLTDRDEELSQLKILNRDLSQRLAHIVI